MSDETSKQCPECNQKCSRDSVHNGVAILFGSWGCSCGWSEDTEYSHNADSRIDSRGGFTPKFNAVVWSKMWNGFELHVIKDSAGKFRSVAVSPWNIEGFLSRAAHDTLNRAVARCYGLVRQDCDLMAQKAEDESRNSSAGTDVTKEEKGEKIV